MRRAWLTVIFGEVVVLALELLLGGCQESGSASGARYDGGSQQDNEAGNVQHDALPLEPGDAGELSDSGQCGNDQEPCCSGAVCRGDLVCTAGTCTHGSSAGICRPADAIGCMVCNSTGSGWTDDSTRCAGGETCENGVCVPSISIRVGREQIVFDWTLDKCNEYDVPDGPSRAFTDSAGNVRLLLRMSGLNYDDYAFKGRTLETVTPLCNPIMQSGNNSDPKAFDDTEWITSPYTFDGRNVYTLIHEEYHGWAHPDGCADTNPATRGLSCWYNSILAAVSTNDGDHYTMPPALDHEVLVPALEYSEYSATNYGYFEPSNIIRHTDGYYYVFFVATTPYEFAHDANGTILTDGSGARIKRQTGSQRTGTCVMRAERISELSNVGGRTAWHVWDGTRFSILRRDPYRETFDPDSQNCAPLDNLQIMHYSVTWNTYLKKYLITGLYLDGSDFFFDSSLSDDLIHWSRPQPMLMVDYDSARGWGMAYGSVIDPFVMGANGMNEQTRNFEKSDNEFYLYFTRTNSFTHPEVSPYDRDLVRVPITLTTTP
jgi:hypothetical protein